VQLFCLQPQNSNDMKRIFYWTILTGLIFCFGNIKAQESKYKLKLKGAAARAYVREHGYPVTRTVHYGKSNTGAHRSAYHSRSAYHKKYTAGRSGARSGHTAYRNTAHKSQRNSYYSGYRRSSAAYYTGLRQATRWDKVKVKSKKDKLVYKFKKDE